MLRAAGEEPFHTSAMEDPFPLPNERRVRRLTQQGQSHPFPPDSGLVERIYFEIENDFLKQDKDPPEALINRYLVALNLRVQRRWESVLEKKRRLSSSPSSAETHTKSESSLQKSSLPEKSEKRSWPLPSVQDGRHDDVSIDKGGASRGLHEHLDTLSYTWGGKQTYTWGPGIYSGRAFVPAPENSLISPYYAVTK